MGRLAAEGEAPAGIEIEPRPRVRELPYTRRPLRHQHFDGSRITECGPGCEGI